MDFYSFLATVIFFGILLQIFFSRKRPKSLPPGPFSLPILGNLLQLGNEPHKTLLNWKSKYGPIISIDFGPFRGVVINDYKLIREAFHEPAFSGRPTYLKAFYIRSGGVPRGILFTEEQRWVEQRRFILRVLRDFGFGRKTMETFVLEEVKELIDTFKRESANDKAIDIKNKFNAGVLNALWTIINGERIPQDNHRFKDLIDRLTTSIQNSKNAGLMLFFPQLIPYAKYLRFIAGNQFDNFEEDLALFSQFLDETIQRHKDTIQEDSPRDFIDSYLVEIKKASENGSQSSSFFGQEGNENLKIVVLDLFIAGAETTSTTLTWAFLYLAMHQEIQEKFHEEIKQCIGLSRLPSLTDRVNMPYTEAVITEVLRKSTLTPLGLFHSTTQDAKLGQYVIPKNTIIIPNQYGALMDPKIWGDPENFRPNRHLTDDGKSVIKHDALLSFSCGKRVCLGESLARDELFLFLTSLFQRFSIKPDPNSLHPSTIEYYAGSIQSPKTFPLVFKDRLETN